MKYNTHSKFPIELLQKLLSKTLDANLIPLEDKVNQEMIDLKYLKETSHQIISKMLLSLLL